MTTNPFRQLPSVDSLLAEFPDSNRNRLVSAARAVLDDARARIRQGEGAPPTTTLLQEIEQRLQAPSSLRPVINATGVIVHTNLGRAPLSKAAIQALSDVGAGYSNLEYDLDAGKRGKRDVHPEALLTELTGAEAALVVNNNAAGMFLTLLALAQGREIVISRGELVEIGGGFRIPDVMRQSGANLVEVGTTNRTRLRDFDQAITDNTLALMRVHTSNFKQIGFTESVALADLATLAHERGIVVFDDLGSGTFLDVAAYGLEHEPTVQESVQAGADLILFSGDKLLGGPQAGLVVGRADLVNALRRHPLARALRPDKLCLAALVATLQHYRDGEALEQIPVWQMISAPLANLESRVQQWQAQLGGAIVDAESTVGGGSLPGTTLPTKALALTVEQPDGLAAALRQINPPIIVRIQNDQVLLDPRTVLPDQDTILIESMQHARNRHRWPR